MKTKKQKLEAIYKEIANKELSHGCTIILKVEDVGYNTHGGNGGDGIGGETVYVKGIYVNNDLALEQDKLGHYMKEYHDESYKNYTYHSIDIDKDVYCDYIYEDTLDSIIGHPVLIGDILDYKNTKSSTILKYINEDWENKRLPIEDQSELLISYVYDLIKSN